MPGLVPGIHIFCTRTRKMWMAGTSPAMTADYGSWANTRAIGPDGQIARPIFAPFVQPLLKKYSGFQKKQITLAIRPSCPTEGRLEIVADAGQDAVDADVPLTNGA
jgi:hypothetical protein